MEHVGIWVRGLGPTLSSCTRQDIKFVGDCKAQITIFLILLRVKRCFESFYTKFEGFF